MVEKQQNQRNAMVMSKMSTGVLLTGDKTFATLSGCKPIGVYYAFSAKELETLFESYVWERFGRKQSFTIHPTVFQEDTVLREFMSKIFNSHLVECEEDDGVYMVYLPVSK